MAHNRYRYSLAEKEILCTINLKQLAASLGLKEVPVALEAEQQQYLKELCDFYKMGDATHPPDLNKANAYAKRCHEELVKTPLLHTKHGYETHSWFTSIRLFLLRLARVLNYIGLSFWRRCFGLLGIISYPLEMVFDFAVVLYDSFKNSPTQNHLSHWQRFKNAMRKPERIFRFLNNTVWFLVNLLGYLFLGHVFIAVNLIGFAFDVIQEIGKSAVQLEPLELLEYNIDENIKDLRAQINNPLISEDEKQVLQAELNNLQLWQIGVEQKHKSFAIDRTYIITMTLLILVGMILVLIPPLTLVGAPVVTLTVIGAIISLFAGSVFISFGKRVDQLISKICNKLVDKCTEGGGAQPKLVPKKYPKSLTARAMQAAEVEPLLGPRLEEDKIDIKSPPVARAVKKPSAKRPSLSKWSLFGRARHLPPVEKKPGFSLRK